jgi:TRAP-type C4-dicarboxylate transport system permease small subunit
MAQDSPPTGTDRRDPRPIRLVANGLAVLAGMAVVALMLLTVVDVFKRKFFGQGLTFAPEVTEIALVATVFLGMMAAQFAGAHVRTPVVTQRLRGRWQPGARLLGLVIAVGLVAWTTVVTLDYGLESWRTGEFRFGLARVPVWPAKLAIPIGMAGLTLALLVEAVRTARQLTGRPASDPTPPDDPPTLP